MENTKQGSLTRHETNWHAACHLGGLIGFFFPLGNIILPMVVWLWKKDDIPSLNSHGIEVINFQISWTIYMLVSGFLVLIIIGLPMLLGLAIFVIVVSVKGALQASEGILYRYPLTIKFLKEKK